MVKGRCLGQGAGQIKLNGLTTDDEYDDDDELLFWLVLLFCSFCSIFGTMLGVFCGVLGTMFAVFCGILGTMFGAGGYYITVSLSHPFLPWRAVLKLKDWKPPVSADESMTSTP